ncbi:MAG: hypothetical protein FJY98_01765 [Candidatus Liptonbacteria bacterium]|nr:hypothetical protein [Candidatus Liptonbacteria bacterium]
MKTGHISLILSLLALLVAAFSLYLVATPNGPLTGPQGPRGETGLAGISGYEVVTKENADVYAVSLGGAVRVSGVTAECPVGRKVIGGGCDGPNGKFMEDNKPWISLDKTKYGWTCSLHVPPGTPDSDYSVTAYAICANVN